MLIRVTASRGTSLRRDVPFYDLPLPVRGRGLALIAAELVRAVKHNEPRGEPTNDGRPSAPGASATAPTQRDTSPALSSSTQPPVAPAPTAPTSVAGTPRAAPRSPRPSPREPAKTRSVATDSTPTYWGVAAQVRGFTPTTTLLTGARAQVRAGSFTAGADWLTTSVDEPVGTTRGNIVSGWVGLLVWSARQPGWWMGTAPRASFGVAMAEGTASSSGRGDSARELYLDAAWQLDARWELSPSGGAFVGADAGVARGMIATSDGRPMAAMGGWFAGARLGLEAAP